MTVATLHMHLPRLPIDKIRPLAEQPIFLELRPINEMSERPVEDVWQSAGTLHVAEKTVPVASVSGCHASVSEAEGGVAGLEFGGRRATFVLDPENGAVKGILGAYDWD